MTMKRPPADNDLVARVREGDQQAFRTLYERYAARLRAQVRRQLPGRLRRRLSESDIVQEVFTTAFQQIDDFKGPHEESFRRWLARIAELKVREATRHHLGVEKRAAGRELSRHRRRETHQFVGNEASPSAHAVAGETGVALDRVLADLREDYRTILHLVHEEGLTVAEAAERMGRSSEATRKLYARALSRLADGIFGASDGKG